MSRYLIRRIEESPAITLRPHTQIEALEGDGPARPQGPGRVTTLQDARWLRTVSLRSASEPQTNRHSRSRVGSAIR